MLPDLDIPKVTLVGLSDMAETFVDKLPNLPTINVANIQKYNMSDAVLEWAGAVLSSAKLPTLAIGDVKLNGAYDTDCAHLVANLRHLLFGPNVLTVM
jgi:hypothetical protein